LKEEIVDRNKRYRYVFYNDDIEIDVDIFPFMIVVEIENRSSDKDPQVTVMYYLEKLGFNLNDTYKLSWDDKYEELCIEQNIVAHKIVTFDKQMPEFKNKLFE